MADLPSISVVTPSFNAVETIEEAIDSVRAQDYPKLEHVVVDGGSTDGTVAILERSEGVRFVSEPDEGRVDAVNKGVAMTSGDVIAWLNADDLYHPGALRAVGEAFAANPGAMWVSGYCDIIDGDGQEIRRAVTAYKNWLLRRWSYPLYLTQNFVSDPATFVRREAFEEAGPLNPRYRISHDYDFWLRVGRRHPPVVLERTLSSFRMTEGTQSMEGFERQFEEHAEIAGLHGAGHSLPVVVNRAMSKLIVLVYHALRALRRRLSGR